MYRHRFHEIRDCWRRYQGDLVKPFRALQDAGGTWKSSHARRLTPSPFPLLDRNWAAFRAQIHTAASSFTSALFGRRSQGMWLGECGYVPGVDELMREEGIRFFFVDTHALLFADPRLALRRPRAGVLSVRRRGLRTRHRELEAGMERSGGLSGRSLAIGIFIAISASICLTRTSRRTSILKAYARSPASNTTRSPIARWTASDSTIRIRRICGAAEHAGQFHVQSGAPDRASSREHGSASDRGGPLRRRALSGHWWYEGPMFLELLFRKLQYDQGSFAPITPSGYLREYPTKSGCDSVLLVLGREGLRRILVQRIERVGLSAPS